VSPWASVTLLHYLRIDCSSGFGHRVSLHGIGASRVVVIHPW
jgi:hypothetical protein